MILIQIGQTNEQNRVENIDVSIYGNLLMLKELLKSVGKDWLFKFLF